MRLQEIHTEEELVAELLKELGDEEPTCQSLHVYVKECSVRVTYRVRYRGCQPERGWILVCQRAADREIRILSLAQNERMHCDNCARNGAPRDIRDCWQILPV